MMNLKFSSMRAGTFLLLTASLLSGLACTANTESTLVRLQAASIAVAPQTVTIIIPNYKPQTGNTYQNLFVSNFSVTAENGTLMYSSARDGLSDTLKQQLTSTYGFNISSPESTVAGFPDLMLYRAGLDLTQQGSLNCASTQQGSGSNDILIYPDTRNGNAVTTLGLRDCDKAYMGLKAATFDFNNNGIPDYLEVRCGLNPANKIQSSLSSASDGMTNLEKCRRHIPIGESATTDANKLFAYDYNITTASDGTTSFNVSNIPIMNNGVDNFIAIYVVETNAATKVSSVYTAFAILNGNYAGKSLKFNYWATTSSLFTNQQIIVP